MSTLSPLRLPSGPPTPRARRRSCWGCLLTGTTGCAAFLVGALAAGLLLSPRIFAPYLAHALARTLDEYLVGELSVEGARLAWAKPVLLHGVRLQDASGTVLLAGELELPGMLELLGEPGTPTVVRAHLEPTRLALDGEGGCALLRALALELQQGDTRLEPAQADGRLDPLLALRRLGLPALAGALRLEVTCDELVWTDARAGEDEERCTGVEISLTSTPAGTSGRVELTARGLLSAGASEEEPVSNFAFSADDFLAPTWDSIEVHASLHGASAARIDALLGTDGWLTSIAGARIDLEAHLEGDPRAGAPVEGSMSGEELRASWKGQWRDGVLRVPIGSVNGTLAGVPRALAERLAELLVAVPAPAGTLATAVDPATGPWTLVDSGFEIDTAIGTPRMKGHERPVTWTCKFAADAPCTIALVSEEQRLVELLGTHWRLEHAANGFELGLSGALRDPAGTAEPGQLAITLRPADGSNVELCTSASIEAQRVPARAFDALLGRSAWIVGALGTTLDANVEIADLLGDQHSLDVELQSDSGHLRFRGSTGESFLASEQEDGLAAELALSPAVEEGFLRKLFPWLADFRALSPSDRLELRLGAFHLPLDGNLVELDGTLRLSAPGWSYRFFDQLERLVASEGEPMRFEGLSPCVLTVEHGEIAYDGLALAMGIGTADGTVSMVDERIELELGVPLGAGASADREESAAPETAIALDLHGTLSEPRLGMGFKELGSFLFKGLEKSDLLETFRRRMSALRPDK